MGWAGDLGISVRMNQELTVVLGGTNAGHHCEMEAEGCRRGGKVGEDGKPKVHRAVMLLIDLPVLPSRLREACKPCPPCSGVLPISRAPHLAPTPPSIIG